MKFDLNRKIGVKINVQWYKDNMPKFYKKVHREYKLKKLGRVKLPLYLDLIKWLFIDFVRGKGLNAKRWGIYDYVGLPGEGKTLSMVAHIERERAKNKELEIYTNFGYKYETGSIYHWTDIVRFCRNCYNRKVPCLIAVDEIHITFDSSEHRSFPPEMNAVLSFNRKYKCQFLFSAQRVDRIPKKIKALSNYTVLCKNWQKCDRFFINYYYDTNDYADEFEADRRKADFVRQYVASDDLYNLYDTNRQVDRMVRSAEKEKDKRLEALEILYGDMRGED